MQTENKDYLVELTEKVEADLQREGISLYPYLEELKVKALNRNAEAACDLGHIYCNGLCGIREDDEEGLRWFRIAVQDGNTKAKKVIRRLAEEGDPRGCFCLGLFYYHGTGYKRNDIKAFNWFSKGADQGDLDCLCYLGVICVEGNFDAESYEKGIDMIRESAEKGSLYGQRFLAESYLKGIGIERSRTDALDWFQKCIDRNDTIAMRMLGEAYMNGTIFKDEEYAFKLFKRGAELKDSDCMFNLAYSYAKGFGTEVNEEESLRWLNEAARYGEVHACLKLADCYYAPDMVEKDDAESFRWMKKAKDLGDKSAYYMLAGYYEKGTGTRKNPEKAFKIYMRAYRKYPTDHDAVRNLIRCYREGIGTEKDESKIPEIYRNSAEKGDVSANLALGQCYEDGIGTKVDPKEAFNCYEKVYEDDPSNIFALERLRKCYKDGFGTGIDENMADQMKRKRDDILSMIRERFGEKGYRMLIEAANIDPEDN